MAKTYVMDFDGGTAAHYDQVMRDMDLGGVAPQGARFHAAGESPTGWRVIDCWDDPAAFDRFAEERIGPLTAKAGLKPPRMQVLEVAGELTGPIRRPEVAMHIVFPGMDEDGFRALDDQVIGLDRRAPDGLVQHVNGPHPEGWYVVDLWETEAKRVRFIETRVMPAAQGIEGRFEILPVHGAIVEHAGARA